MLMRAEKSVKILAMFLGLILTGPLAGTTAFAVPPPDCNGMAATIIGTDGNDNLSGTPASDIVSLGLGNDKFNGNGGDDVICGGPGNDQLKGNGGNDQIFGEDGNDDLQGGNDNDYMIGALGNDKIDGGNGVDIADTQGDDVKAKSIEIVLGTSGSTGATGATGPTGPTGE